MRRTTTRFSKLWLLLVGVCALSVGVGIAVLGHTASPPAQGQRASTNPQHYWDKPLQAFSTPLKALTDGRVFYIGDVITMPDGLKLKVTSVQRNWQPPAVVTNTFGREQDGDNPAGYEVVLVWFRAMNAGTSPIVYNDSEFTLVALGEHELRIAQLASLLPTAYGDKGVEPWLLPGETKETFVPFLVTPGSTLTSFQYYFVPPLSATQAPLLRLSISLEDPSHRTSANLTFKPDKAITVGL